MFLARGRYVTTWTTTEPAIAIASDEPVCGIANGSGNHLRNKCQHFPDAPDISRDDETGFGLGIRATCVKDQKARRCERFDSGFGERDCAPRRLHG